MVTLDQGGRAADAVMLSSVPMALRPWVEQVFAIDFRGTEESDWKVLPDTCGHLLVHVPASDADRTSVNVVGSRTRAITADVTGRAWTVGVRFRPGGLGALGRESAAAFTDRSVCPASVWGSKGRRLRASVIDHRAVDATLASLLGELTALANASPEVDWRVEGFTALVRDGGGRLAMSDAADRLGVAPRTLRIAAKAGLGLSPKRYARVERLFRALAGQDPTTWAERATRSGFADQAHLVRECRKLLGETPTRFAARRVPKRSSD